MDSDKKYLTVSDLNYYVAQKFKRDPYLQTVFLQGEISNFRYRRNGHQYFSLKDENSAIDVMMFRNYFSKLKFKPEEGMKVYVRGRVSVYEARGSYEFYVEEMEPAGVGILYERFRQLQEKLNKEGLFRIEHKRSLPKFPDKIAVVTSPSGAVIHDIMVTANRRFPHAEIDLYPAKVQGDSAADSLVNAMQRIESRKDEYDVMIIGRGGGSLEDLWPFNEEAVVRQVYAMSMPVISSVGHETDTTLCDLVADRRAATPTAAAELATPNLSEELAKLHQLQSRLLANIQSVIRIRKEALKQIDSSIIMRSPERLYDQQIQRFDTLKERLLRVINLYINNADQSLKMADQKLYSKILVKRVEQIRQNQNYLSDTLIKEMQNLLNQKHNEYLKVVQQLDDYSPLKTLKRGYSYVTDDKNDTITSIKQVKEGQEISIHLVDGEFTTVVEKIREK